MTLRYFHPREFECQCGCGQNLINQQYLEEFDALRHEVGFPMIVTSGYRCPKHNARVSSTGLTGPHTTGHAGDYKVRAEQAYRVVAAAYRRGFTGIGVKQHGNVRFIHLDNLPNTVSSPRPRIWSYP